MRVLRYLPTQLTAPEIARQLFVSVHTVTTHTRHIYAKLGVHRRHEAVDRARARGLLAPIPGSHQVPREPGSRPATTTPRTGAPLGALGAALSPATGNGQRPGPAPRCPRVRTRQSATALARAEQRLTKAATVAAWRPGPAACAIMPVAGSAAFTSLWPGGGYASLDLLGRAFVAPVAYVDPGNFAGNIQGAARYGNPRLWVVRDTNLMMMVVQ